MTKAPKVRTQAPGPERVQEAIQKLEAAKTQGTLPPLALEALAALQGTQTSGPEMPRVFGRVIEDKFNGTYFEPVREFEDTRLPWDEAVGLLLHAADLNTDDGFSGETAPYPDASGTAHKKTFHLHGFDTNDTTGLWDLLAEQGQVKGWVPAVHGDGPPVSTYLEDQEIHAREVLQAPPEWSVWSSGGGCVALRREIDHKPDYTYALITAAEDGSMLPESRMAQVMLGFYDENCRSAPDVFVGSWDDAMQHMAKTEEHLRLPEWGYLTVGLGTELENPRWGARAIYARGDHPVDLLPDRQSMTGTNSVQRRALADWVNYVALPWLNKTIAKECPAHQSGMRYAYGNSAYQLQALVRGGYIYIGVGLKPQEMEGAKWSGDGPIPDIGGRVHVQMNNLGPGQVVGYFSEGGWAGVRVALENTPEHLVKQNAEEGGKHCEAFVFGADLGSSKEKS